MSKTLHAIYDGEVFRPEDDVNLEPNTRYLIIVEPDGSNDQATVDTPYPLTVIESVATDMGLTDLAENHDRYAHRRLEDRGDFGR